MKGLFFIFILLLLATAVESQNLQLYEHQKNLGITIKNVVYPETLNKNLKNGFTTKLRLDVTLKQGDRIVSSPVYFVSAYYDIWEDWFHIELKRGNEVVQTFKPKQMGEATHILQNLELKNVESLDKFEQDSSYKINISIALNPLEKEKVQEIKKWVFQNSVSNPLPSGGSGSTNTSNRLGGLFSKVYDEYTKNNNPIGSWEQSFSTEFLPRILKDEKSRN